MANNGKRIIQGINGIINEIKLIKKKENLLPLVGAGFSANVPGMPLWQDLEGILIEKNKENKEKKKSKDITIMGTMSEAAGMSAPEKIEGYIRQLGRVEGKGNYTAGKKKFAEIMNAELEEPLKKFKDKTQTQINKYFIELVMTFDTIMTTNWDTFIEEAILIYNKRADRKNLYAKVLQAHPIGERFSSELLMRSVGEKKNGNRTIDIIKYHGCIKRPETLVASEHDYFERLRVLDQNCTMEGNVDYGLSNRITNGKRLLLIGYSLEDLNLKYVLRQLNSTWNAKPENSNGRKNKAAHYMVLISNPKLYCSKYATYLEEVYNIKMLYLFPEDHRFHFTNLEWGKARKELGKKNPIYIKLNEERGELIRERFCELFKKLRN